MKKLYLIAVLCGVAQGCFGAMVTSANNLSTVFEFREPEHHRYTALYGLGENLPTGENAEWIQVHPETESDRTLELGRRLILTPAATTTVQQLLVFYSTQLSR